MGKELTGRPKHVDWPDTDIDRHGVHIPDGAIHTVHLSDTTKLLLISIPTGVYGQTTYGQCKYGLEIGWYGTSRYGHAMYYEE